MERKGSDVGRISALIYTLISAGVSLTFFVVASGLGRYTQTAIVGGTAWVFLLTMIVTMPTVTPWVKRRLGN